MRPATHRFLRAFARLVFMSTVGWPAVAAAASASPDTLPAFPLQPSEEGSAYRRWLAKPVRDSVAIDDVENLDGWTTRGVGRIELTSERAHSGTQALRFSAPMWNREFFERRAGPNLFGTTGGATQAVKVFSAPQDWSAFNRISVWAYVHDTGRRTYNVTFMFNCLGLADRTTVPRATFNANSLKPGAWNHIVWEVPHLKRDRVTEFIVHIETSGYDSDARGDLVLDVDQIELQRVETDNWQGWTIEPNRIALSQIGYAPHARKVAIINPTAAARFDVVEAQTGNPIVSRPISATTVQKTGRFGVLDFSELRKPGRYFLQAGEIRSDVFAISEDYWRPALLKALNFFYCERCGVDIPGVHNVCHQDLIAEDGGETKTLFGGWHDAADFSQLTGNTAEAAYAMLELAGQLRLRGLDPALRDRIEEECRIGLDWLQKTLFASGKRVPFVEIRHYTDGVRGTADDRRGAPASEPVLNFVCAATQAKAAAHFQANDPDYARKLRAGAERDWNFGIRAAAEPRTATLHELSWTILAGVELARLTGVESYKIVAIERASYALECQERAFLDGMPLTGFFYEKPDRRRILQPDHMCHEEAAVAAFAALCSAYPDHANWMQWYSASTLYAEFFLTRGAGYTAPFHYLPNAVYQKSAITSIPDENVRADRLGQLEAGTPLSDNFYLRAFPIWTTPWARGSTGIQFSRTLALSAAAGLANDLERQQLARWQVEWVFGRNPFVKSLMYGEGHYTPMHSHRQGELVGAIPVGIDCIANDEPFWPVGTNRTNKEIWVVPVARFIWATAALGLPARLEGRSDGPLTFVDTVTGVSSTIEPDTAGRFRCNLPSGEYAVRRGGDEWQIRLISGRNYQLDLRTGRSWKGRLVVLDGASTARMRRLRLELAGRGHHSVALRLFNARSEELEREIVLEPGRDSSVEWEVEILDQAQPWIAVALFAGNADMRLSVIGK